MINIGAELKHERKCPRKCQKKKGMVNQNLSNLFQRIKMSRISLKYKIFDFKILLFPP